MDENLSLDYVPGTRCFVLRVARNGELNPQTLMREYGLDFSQPASTREHAVLYTKEPYAAASFAHYATPAARQQLAPILSEIEASWAGSSEAHIRVPEDKELWGFQKAGIE